MSNWRKFHWVLFGIVLAVAIIRIATGNILGALLPLILAALFGSIAVDYPVWSRLRRVQKLIRRILS